jgi:hypothetical protein
LSFISFSRLTRSAAIAQMPQKAAPTLEVLFFALGNTQDLPKAVGSDANRHQHRNIAYLPGPARLEDQAEHAACSCQNGGTAGGADRTSCSAAFGE